LFAVKYYSQDHFQSHIESKPTHFQFNMTGKTTSFTQHAVTSSVSYINRNGAKAHCSIA